MSSICRYTVGRNAMSVRGSTNSHYHSESPNDRDFWPTVEKFLVHLQASGSSFTTIQSYKESLKLLAGCVGTAVPLRGISTELLNGAVASMSTIGSPGGPRRSEATLNRHRTAYRQFFQWAFQTGKIPTNPALLLHRARVDSVPTAPFTPKETSRFLRAIRRSKDSLRLRDEALFSTYALAGLRRKEALLLDRSDYNAKDRLLCIRNGKGGHVRSVPVMRSLGRLLQKLQSESLPSGGQGNGKLFPGRAPGTALTARQAQKRFERWKTTAGLRPELTIHSFRAGFATALHRGCGDVIMVSHALGHSDLRATLRYIKINSASLPQIIERSLADAL
jgi:site-specific recombinase XerD